MKKRSYFELRYVGLSVLAIIFVAFILNYIGFNILNSSPYPKSIPYTTAIYQVGAFANAGYEFSDEEKLYLEGYLPIEFMANNFRKEDGDRLARISDKLLSYLSGRDIGEFDYSGLINVNLSLFIHRPIFYIKSLLDLDNILWKFERDNYGYFLYLYKYSWPVNDGTYYLKEHTIMYKETRLNYVVDSIVDFGLKKVLFDFRVRGALPLFMLILSALIFIKKKKYKFLFSILFILYWYALLSISLPISMCRYCLPFINIYPFIFCLALGIKNN